MADIIQKYDAFWLHTASRKLDWVNQIVRLAFLANTYTPDIANDSIFGDVSAHQISGAVNYPVGGPALVSKTLTATAMDADNVEFNNLTATYRYAVLYIDETVDGVVQPLLGYFEPTSGADVVIQNSNYVVEWSNQGVFSLS